MSLYTLYKELLPPSAVHHVVTAKFTSASDVNVILAKASLLQVYKLIEEQSLALDNREGVIDDMQMTDQFNRDDDQASVRGLPLTHALHVDIYVSYLAFKCCKDNYNRSTGAGQ